MKKTSTRAKNKSRNNSVPCEDNLTAGDEGKEGDVEDVPAVHLRSHGVKLEAEGHVGAPGGILETVEEVVEAPWGDMPGPDLSQAYVVDLTQQFNRIFVQTTFNSFKEFERLFNRFKAETGSVFRIKSSCSIAYENSRRKKHLIPSRFKFVTVRYCCVHYGQPKVAGHGIRTKQRYLPCGCESVLAVSYNRGALVISHVNMQHNHEVSSEMAPFYSINRRISKAELQEVAGAAEMIPNSRSLQRFLQIHFQRPTTLQDAKNVRARLKALKAPPATAITKPNADEEKQFSPYEEEEEEEMEEVEEVIMECNEENSPVDFKEDLIEEGVEGGENYHGGKSSVHKTLMQQEQQEIQEQEPVLDPRTRKQTINRTKERLDKALQNCDTLVFMERISVIEGLLEGWEKYNTDYAQNPEESGYIARMGRSQGTHGANTLSIQERLQGTQSRRQTDPQAETDAIDTRIGRTQVLPRLSNDRLTQFNQKSQSAFATEKLYDISNVTVFAPCYGNSVRYSKRDVQVSRRIQISDSNEIKPVVLSIAKGLVDGCEQAEVEIEVDGEVPKVRTVKKEVLEHHEALYW